MDRYWGKLTEYQIDILIRKVVIKL